MSRSAATTGTPSGWCPPSGPWPSSSSSPSCSAPRPRPPEDLVMPSKRIPRRTFVAQAGTAAAFTIVPRHVLGRGYRAPSDTLNLACIGIGGMGANDVKGMSGEHIYALCDVDQHQGEDSFNAFPQAKRFQDYREMLAKEKDHIDVVTVTPPDHSHAPAAMLAMKAGKHTDRKSVV